MFVTRERVIMFMFVMVMVMTNGEGGEGGGGSDGICDKGECGVYVCDGGVR